MVHVLVCGLQDLVRRLKGFVEGRLFIVLILAPCEPS